MINILSFDVEEWFDSHFIKNKDLNKMERRVYIGVKKILDILRPKKIKCTFFILGRIAEENSDIVRIIDSEGHEIASHGYSHRPISQQTSKELEQDILFSMKILKSITHKDVLGYRAPGYTITKDTMWALDVIKDCGLRYDSSIYPVSLRLFTSGGIAGYPNKPFFIRENLVEFPLPTISIFGFKFPVATTSYFRIFPFSVTERSIKMLNDRGIMATLNFHSWEFDKTQPKMELPFIQHLKHYYNLDKVEDRLKRLICNYKFTNCQNILEHFFSKDYG